MQTLEVTEHWLVDRYQAALFPLINASLPLLELLQEVHAAASSISLLLKVRRHVLWWSFSVLSFAECTACCV